MTTFCAGGTDPVVACAPGARARLVLPRSAFVTDALLAPPVTSVSAGQLVDLRSKLVEEVRAVREAYPSSSRLEIGVHDLVRALERRERPFDRGGFAPSPALCRRAVGIAAVERCVRGRAPAPQCAVSDVLGGALEDLARAAENPGAPRPPWWAEYYAGLDRGGRAVVHAEAVTWATSLWSALDWDRLLRPPVVGGRDDRWNLPGSAKVSLRGRTDVKVWTGNRQACLTIGSRFPIRSWALTLVFPALVGALGRGERCTPVRIVGFWPSSGALRVREVDAAALADAASATVVAVRAYLESESASR